jgi:hypothetical protein
VTGHAKRNNFGTSARMGVKCCSRLAAEPPVRRRARRQARACHSLARGYANFSPQQKPRSCASFRPATGLGFGFAGLPSASRGTRALRQLLLDVR